MDSFNIISKSKITPINDNSWRNSNFVLETKMEEKRYTAVLIDDEKPALDVLIYLIKKHCPEITIIDTFQDPLEAEKFILTKSPDLAFVDIRMRTTNGLQLIERLNNSNTDFILTTAYSEYALEAWRTKAINYLLKPVDPEDLVLALEKYKTLQTSHLDQETKIVKIGSENINLNSVLYIIADGSYSRLVLTDVRVIMLSKNLKTILEALNDEDFFRIHRSQIINVNHIVNINEKKGQVTLKANTVCEISNRKLNQFMEFMNHRKFKW